jgi:hypothetical protein
VVGGDDKGTAARQFDLRRLVIIWMQSQPLHDLAE